jgi:type VI secretion system protein
MQAILTLARLVRVCFMNCPSAPPLVRMRPGGHAMAVSGGLRSPSPSLVPKAMLVASLMMLAPLQACNATRNAVASSIGAITGTPRALNPSWQQVVISADPDANQNSPLALDLVFIKDPTLLDVLLQTPASKWFATREDLLKTHPQTLLVKRMELVPRQSIQIPEKELAPHRSLAVFVFADYPGSGEHRKRLPLQGKGFLVQAGAKSIRVTELMSP